MARPQNITVQSYQVGFGDCFLLGFHYRTSSRWVLVDFGSTALPRYSPKGYMTRVAEDIAAACDGKLHAVVATHRHKDHISGFDPLSRNDGPGAVIAGLKPDVVIQPWTEDPKAKPDATGPTRGSRRSRAFVGMLDGLDSVSQAISLQAAVGAGMKKASELRRQLEFLGDTNLANRAAVENLMTMGKNRYVYFGARSGLRLPGVRVSVLGPPTLRQSETIKKQRHTHDSEFWHLLSVTETLGVSTNGQLFPKHRLRTRPERGRWIEKKLAAMRPRQLQEIVRIVDKALNNTSVILLFEVGDQKLLFPGDAQFENWSYALGQPGIKDRLRDATVYKVGHHGSLNATPKSLWNLFRNRGSDSNSRGRLKTFVSTMAGKHGSKRRDTEVPRTTLVEALQAETDYYSTQTIEKPEISRTTVIPINYG